MRKHIQNESIDVLAGTDNHRRSQNLYFPLEKITVVTKMPFQFFVIKLSVPWLFLAFNYGKRLGVKEILYFIKVLRYFAIPPWIIFVCF